MARNKQAEAQGQARKKGKDRQGYARLQENAPEEVQYRGAPVRSFGRLNHSLTWNEIVEEEEQRTRSAADEQAANNVLPLADIGGPAAGENAYKEDAPPAQAPDEIPLQEQAPKEQSPGEITEEVPEGETVGENPLTEQAPKEQSPGENPLTEQAPPEHVPGENPLMEQAPKEQSPGENPLTEETSEEASVEESMEESGEESEAEEAPEEEAHEEVYHPPMVFLKHVKWDTSGEEEPGQQNEEKKARRKRAKPYLEVVVETPNVGSREAMDANTDPGHTSAVLEFTAKTSSNEYKRAHLHVGFHPRAGAGIGGMEEALLHRTDYPGEVKDDSGTLTSASVRRRFPIDKGNVKAALDVMEKYNSGMPYNLIYNNCTTFVANVAKQAEIPGVEGAFQESDWQFGYRAQIKLEFLRQFGGSMAAVKNKPAEMRALLKKRDYNAFDQMRLSDTELKRFTDSLQQERGGSMQFHGYSPSDVAENLLAMQDKNSVLIVNNPGDKDKKDVDSQFQRAAWMHMLGKLGNANMDGETPDGGKKALGLPAPQDFQRDIKKAATKWNYFSAWRREIRGKKGWSNPYGPQEVEETVRQMPEHLQDALEQYQVVRTAQLGVSDEDLQESADGLLDTVQTVQQQAKAAVDALQNTKAPEAFVAYWEKLETASMTAGQFKPPVADTKDAEEDAEESATESDMESEDGDEIWAEDEDEKIDDAIPLDRIHELLAREPDDALATAVQDKLAGSVLAPFLHNSIPGLLQQMYKKMDNHWLNGIKGKGLWDMSDGMVVFRLLPDKNRHKAYEGLLKSLRGSKGKEAMNTWKQKLAELHAYQKDIANNKAINTEDTRPKTAEEAIEQHLRAIPDTGTQTMLLGFALRKAAAANHKSAEEMYAQQRKEEIGLQAEPKAADLPAGLVPTARAEQIKNAIRGALQGKPAEERLTMEEVRQALTHYEAALQTALLGLFPEGLTGGQDSAQAIAQKACTRLAEEILQSDGQAVNLAIYMAQEREKLASLEQRGSMQQAWDALCTTIGEEQQKALQNYEIGRVTVKKVKGGSIGVYTIFKAKNAADTKAKEAQNTYIQAIQPVIAAALDLLQNNGLDAEQKISAQFIYSALLAKKRLDELFA